jgi:hypothetical protein
MDAYMDAKKFAWTGDLEQSKQFPQETLGKAQLMLDFFHAYLPRYTVKTRSIVARERDSYDRS